MHPPPDLAVVGGGIAGLVAAIEAALAGARVALFEQASRLGGRARSSRHHGFLFNQGPHALFHQGALARWLRRQGLLLAGGFSMTHPARFLRQGRLFEMPLGATALLGASWLTPAEKWELARTLLRFLRAEPSSLKHTTVSALVAPLSSSVRALVEALVRLATYGGSFDEMSAECALSQLQLATRGGVRYLDGGWQSLVDALEERARSLGVELRTGEGVRAIEGAPPALHLRTDRGDVVPSRAVLVTGAPGRVAALIEPEEGSLHRFAGGAIPVRAASLDVALRPGVPTGGLVLGEDGLYLNDHGRSARLGPEGGALVHALRYDGGGETEEGMGPLEALLSAAIPGWREARVHQQFLPRIVVHHALVTASMGGYRGRPPVESGRPGVWIAGDWVGAEGALADASAASGSEAARQAIRWGTMGRRDAG